MVLQQKRATVLQMTRFFPGEEVIYTPETRDTCDDFRFGIVDLMNPSY